MEGFKNYYLEEKRLTQAEEDALPDSAFGYIDEKGERHFPLNDEKRLRAALSYFHYCPDKYKKELAQKILKVAKEHDVEVSSEDVLKAAK